jgi:hypothetical protein
MALTKVTDKQVTYKQGGTGSVVVSHGSVLLQEPPAHGCLKATCR